MTLELIGYLLFAAGAIFQIGWKLGAAAQRKRGCSHIWGPPKEIYRVGWFHVCDVCRHGSMCDPPSNQPNDPGYWRHLP